ncbi:hypothetical protein V5799_002715 [Amblyomma americanum]|uniref:Uncharacterized protein n=1 Tax=Amblyomma americanum TaxID=6943 RepID=A0AAQ4DB13_AMBAM
MDMEMSWLSKLPYTLEKSADDLPVLRKVAAMLNSCMTDTDSQVVLVKEFMREHGLSWPEDPEPNLGPLKVLFNLAFNWNVNLWFSLKLLPTANDHQKRRILFTPSGVMLFWRALFTQIPKKHFKKVYTDIFKLFANSTNGLPPPGRIEEDYKSLQYVFSTLVRSSTWKARVPAVFPLRELENHSKTAKAEHIKEAIDAMLAIKPPFTMDDLVLFSDMALLDGVLKIFEVAGDRTVQRHLAWLFLFAYAAVANPGAVLLILHGSTSRATEERLRFCADQVEASYKLLVFSAAVVAHFSEEERRRIDGHLAGMMKVC